MTVNVTGGYELGPLVTVVVHPEQLLIKLTVAKYAFTAKSVAVTDHQWALKHRGGFDMNEKLYAQKRSLFKKTRYQWQVRLASAGKFAHLTRFSIDPPFRCRAQLYNEKGDGFETTNSFKKPRGCIRGASIKPKRRCQWQRAQKHSSNFGQLSHDV